MDNLSCAYGATCSIIESISIVAGGVFGGMGLALSDMAFSFPWFFSLVAGIVGAILASFSGVVVDRLPAMLGWNGRKPSNITLSLPSSHCDSCRKPIPKPYLVPVLGYVWTRGRCSHCSAQVPAKYPIIEAATAVLSVIIVALVGPGPSSLGLCVLLWALLPIAWIDWNEHEIPDLLTVPLAAAGLMFSPFEADASARIFGLVIAGATMWGALRVTAHVKSVDTDAYGDVALCAAGAAWLGICGVPAFLLLASLSYAAYAVPTRKITGNDWVPMGPAIAAGVLIVAAFGLNVA